MKNLRKIILAVLFVFVLVHLVKDVTQDILRIASPLDLLGDVTEDLSAFPRNIQLIFLILGISSFLAEAFLLFAIPVVFKRTNISRLEKSVYVIVGLMFIYLIGVTLLDPRFAYLNLF